MRTRRSRIRSWLALFATTIFAMTLSWGARAEASHAQASALAADAEAARAAGLYERCIEKDQASIDAEPSTATRVHLAGCAARIGRVLLALEQLRVVLDQALAEHDAEVAELARKRVEQLLQRLGALTIVPPPDAKDLVVTVDDVALGPAQLKKALAVDPGRARVLVPLQDVIVQPHAGDAGRLVRLKDAPVRVRDVDVVALHGNAVRPAEGRGRRLREDRGGCSARGEFVDAGWRRRAGVGRECADADVDRAVGVGAETGRACRVAPRRHLAEEWMVAPVREDRADLADQGERDDRHAIITGLRDRRDRKKTAKASIPRGAARA